VKKPRGSSGGVNEKGSCVFNGEGELVGEKGEGSGTAELRAQNFSAAHLTSLEKEGEGKEGPLPKKRSRRGGRKRASDPKNA